MKNKFPIVIVVVVLLLVGVGTFLIFKNLSNNKSQNNYNVENNGSIDNTSSLYIEQTTGIVLSTPRAFKPFNEGIELLPTKLYLSSETSPKKYLKEDGKIIDIEVLPCDGENERIEYNDGELVIYKNSGVVKAFGKEYELDNYSQEDNSALFAGYYGEVDNLYRAYNTNIDNDLNTKEISFVQFNDGSINRKFLINEKDNISEFLAPIYLGNRITDEHDVYYSNRNFDNYSLDEITNENIPFSYFVFSKQTGFEEKFSLLDSSLATSNHDILTKEFTLNDDYYYKEYPIDEKYNVDDQDKISYYLVRGESENKLSKGTTFMIVKVLDEYGNCIIKTEDGTLYILGRN